MAQDDRCIDHKCRHPAGATVKGGSAGDTIAVGDANADVVEGGAGADTITFDIEVSDVVTGGAGADIFLMDNEPILQLQVH